MNNLYYVAECVQDAFRLFYTFAIIFIVSILTFFVGIFHDCTCYTQRTFLYIGQWWIKIAAVQIGLRYQVGESRRGNKESLLGNGAHTSAYCGQRDSREYVTIITLARIVSFIVIRDWWERRAACEYASSLCNSNNG